MTVKEGGVLSLIGYNGSNADDYMAGQFFVAHHAHSSGHSLPTGLVFHAMDEYDVETTCSPPAASPRSISIATIIEYIRED